jgi:hypothetical protein
LSTNRRGRPGEELLGELGHERRGLKEVRPSLVVRLAVGGKPEVVCEDVLDPQRRAELRDEVRLLVAVVAEGVAGGRDDECLSRAQHSGVAAKRVREAPGQQLEALLLMEMQVRRPAVTMASPCVPGRGDGRVHWPRQALTGLTVGTPARD